MCAALKCHRNLLRKSLACNCWLHDRKTIEILYYTLCSNKPGHQNVIKRHDLPRCVIGPHYSTCLLPWVITDRTVIGTNSVERCVHKQQRFQSFQRFISMMRKHWRRCCGKRCSPWGCDKNFSQEAINFVLVSRVCIVSHTNILPSGFRPDIIYMLLFL